MSVADHTALITLGEHPAYSYVLLRQFAQQRRILVVPAPSLSVAIAFADTPDMSPLLDSRVVVRGADWSYDLAPRIGTEVPVMGPQSEWMLVAPVAFWAQTLGMPVLTRTPALYQGYDLQIETMP